MNNYKNIGNCTHQNNNNYKISVKVYLNEYKNNAIRKIF